MPLLIWFMYGAIALNYELGLVTIEISDVVSKLMLSSELEPE
jgi:hypothetical protein